MPSTQELQRLLFRFLPHTHDWDEFSYAKRRCRRCGREEWLFENRHPAVGEPRYEWKALNEPRWL